MSKILKIFVNLVVLFAIVIAAALLVPPFAGVDTVMNDNTEIDTNLPIGSVAYGKTVNVNKLGKNDKIIYTEGSSAYVYQITDMDSSAGAYKVKDVYNKNSDEEHITLQKEASKVLIVVPFIGYAAIALQSKEGLIVIGLGIVLLIILFILSELWRKDDDEEEDDEYEDEEEEDDDEEEEEELSRKERRRLKKEEKRRRKLEKKGLLDEEEEEPDEDEDDEEEEEQLSRKERRRLKKEEKRRRKLERKGLLDEDEDEEEEIPSLMPEEASPESSSEPHGFDDAMKDAMSSIAMGVAQVSQPEQTEDATIAMPDAEEIEAAVQKEASVEEVPQEVEPEVQETEIQEEETDDLPDEAANNIEEILQEESPVNSNSVPKTPTIEELLGKAQAAGEQPEIIEDKENEVTLLDYSELL